MNARGLEGGIPMTNKMKTPKLALNRETLRSLSRDKLAQAAGGFSGMMGCNCSLGMCDDTKTFCMPFPD
jgi:hypothetical protein